MSYGVPVGSAGERVSACVRECIWAVRVVVVWRALEGVYSMYMSICVNLFITDIYSIHTIYK